MQSILSKSLFSKILATEDINLIISKEANTASFTYPTRTLTLPDWNTSPELDRLLISHEVAHALFTDSEKRKEFIDSYDEEERSFVAMVLNIVEDARIEKLIMRKYPGLTKDYILGYKELIETFGFFKNAPYTNVYDKLNHHFKAVVSGKYPNIYQFDQQEEYFVDKMLSLETYKDTIDTTIELLDIYGISKIETSTVFNSKLEEGDVDPDVCCGAEKNPETLQNYKINTVSSKRYILSPTRKLNIQKEKTSSDIIKFMNLLFKRKMNAKKYKNQRIQKTGEIDITRLYRYKYDEKIFETKLKKNKQNKHAVIMLVDGSSSMTKNMKGVAEQAFNIAEFCKLSKIPFECYLFKDSGVIIDGFPDKSNVRLYEFFNKGSDFDAEKWYMSKEASGSTPLSEALIVLFDRIEDLKQKYDVVNLMIITDGACNNSHKTIEIMRYKNTYITPNLKEQITNIPTSIYKIFRDYYNVNIISFDLGEHSCYNSYYNKFGVDIHFQVPLKFITNLENSKKFLTELIDIISK